MPDCLGRLESMTVSLYPTTSSRITKSTFQDDLIEVLKMGALILSLGFLGSKNIRPKRPSTFTLRSLSSTPGLENDLNLPLFCVPSSSFFFTILKKDFLELQICRFDLKDLYIDLGYAV